MRSCLCTTTHILKVQFESNLFVKTNRSLKISESDLQLVTWTIKARKVLPLSKILYLFPTAEQWPESSYIFFSCFEKLKSSCKSRQQLNKCCIKFAFILKVFHLLTVPHGWKCVSDWPSWLCIVKGCWSGLVSVRELCDHKLFNCPTRKAENWSLCTTPLQDLLCRTSLGLIFIFLLSAGRHVLTTLSAVMWRIKYKKTGPESPLKVTIDKMERMQDGGSEFECYLLVTHL